MKRAPLLAIIFGITALVVFLAVWSSAQLVASILFTFPIVLCAPQRSKRILWGTTVVAIAVSIAAGAWESHRVELVNPWAAAANRGLFIASLFTLTILIHLWINKSRKIADDAATMERQSNSLVATNAQLEILMGEARRSRSEREGAEKHLAQMEAMYRGLLEASPDAMVVMNQTGEIVLLNVQAERQFGYRRDELVGQKVKDIIPEGFAERLIAVGMRTAAEPLAQQIGTGLELKGRRKDGSEFPIDIMLSPLESAEGVLVTAAIRDITERRRIEDALRLNEERFRLIVSNVKDYANIMLDTEGLIVSWNQGAERIKGYRAEEIIGQHFSRFYCAEDLRNGVPALELKQASEAGRFEGEGWRVRKDGSRFLANIVITALHDEKGRLRGFGKITRDITERRQAEEALMKTMAELKRSNEELGQFAYVASHDLQEPLRMVASYTQLLAQRYKGRLDSDADEFIGYAVDGCKRMQRLIQDLLSYSRAGTNIATPRKISVERTLEEAITNLQVAIKESGAVVTHDPLPAIVTDDAQVVQLFQNLIGNAIKYHGAEAPHVHVSATNNAGHEWIFSVRDNGLGIEPLYFEKIFILFQRLHGQEEFEGTGIGLAMCRKIADRLGGRIWVDSQPMHGSTFFFALPAGDGK
jgi:PAS domain S-box-containing protein